MRFAVREATLDDARGIARVHTDSWQESYRGILPSHVLDRIDVGQRLATRERILRARSGLNLVAYDVTHGDIVGFCDAGASRGHPQYSGEVYAIYFAHHAKRYGLGREMFERVRDWLPSRGMHSMIVWVLANNPHARRFYEAMGGVAGHTKHSTVGGYPVVEQAYLWARV
ncbi:MAG TPA: GNAT family N-acetyltransferase [Kofleriaceae bacterium]|nr:GNAT family N-acetyltransferase [Kofleriaceae bacterium]